MPIIISEVIVEMQAPNADVPFSELGPASSAELNDLLIELEVSEERNKRLLID